jgi:hypothetical protein
MVSVNESYAVVLEGQEEGEMQNDRRMGVYERIEGKLIGGRGVWQAVGGVDLFLHYYKGWDYYKGWIVGNRKNMEACNGQSGLGVNSPAPTPDQIIEKWKAHVGTSWVKVPNLRVRVCSSVEKHAAEQRVEQQQEQALEQAQLLRRLVVEGLANDRYHTMGIYELIEGKVVNRRAVWQKQGGAKERFLYYASSNKWYVSKMERMETGCSKGFIKLATTALTPDQTRPSNVWSVLGAAGGGWKDAPEVQVQRQT